MIRSSSGIITELTRLPSCEPEDQLAAAVLRGRRPLELGHRDHRPLGQRARKSLGRSVIAVEVEDALAIDPGRELAARDSARRPARRRDLRARMGGIPTRFARDIGGKNITAFRQEVFHQALWRESWITRWELDLVVDSSRLDRFAHLMGTGSARPSDRIRPPRPTAARRRTRSWRRRCQQLLERQVARWTDRKGDWDAFADARVEATAAPSTASSATAPPARPTAATFRPSTSRSASCSCRRARATPPTPTRSRRSSSSCEAR